MGFLFSSVESTVVEILLCYNKVFKFKLNLKHVSKPI